MGRNTCFVPGCSSGYSKDRKKCKEEGIKVKSLFAAPKDADLFEKWKRSIPRKDKDLCRNCSVCEVHFLSEDIIRSTEIKMPDGSIDTYDRSHPKLKAGAVPCLFPDLSQYLSKRTRKRKLPMDRTVMTLKRCKNVISSDQSKNDDILISVPVFIDSPAVASEEFNFNSLSKCETEKPDEWWCVNMSNGQVTLKLKEKL